MGNVAIYPWLKIKEKIVIQGFELIPFKINESSLQFETVQEDEDIKGVASNYFDSVGNPLKEVVVLKKCGKLANEILTEEDINSLFVFNDLLIFSSLGERRFFSYSYWNRDHFQLVIQRFTPKSYTPSVVSRRRDGSMMQGFFDGLFKERAPLHISLSQFVEVDILFLKSLIQIWEEDIVQWVSVYESIQSYNMANTDSNQMREHLELVMLNGCFERLFDLGGGNFHALKDNFLKAFSVVLQDGDVAIEKDISKFGLKSDFKLREAFIKDLFNIRGNLAHGKIAHKYPSVWSLKEHLLFASYIFPFLVKFFLAGVGKYALTDEDKTAVFAFDHLLASGNIFEEKPPGSQVHRWNEIMSECAWTYMYKSELDEV